MGAPTIRLASRFDAAGIAALSRDRIEQGLGWSWTAPRVLRSIHDRGTNVVVAGDAAPHARLRVDVVPGRRSPPAVARSASRAPDGVASAQRWWVGWNSRRGSPASGRCTSKRGSQTNAEARAFYARSSATARSRRCPATTSGREACVRLAKDLWLAPVANRNGQPERTVRPAPSRRALPRSALPRVEYSAAPSRGISTSIARSSAAVARASDSRCAATWPLVLARR